MKFNTIEEAVEDIRQEKSLWLLMMRIGKTR